MTLLTRDCPMCGGRPARSAFPYETRFNNVVFSYLECSDCRSVFVDPIPDDKTFALMYAKDAYHDCHYADGVDKADQDHKAYSQSAKLLKGELLTGSLVLDYGCGLGGFLLALREEGLVPFGIEFDEGASAHAAHRAAAEVYSVEGFGRLAPKPRFDAIHLGDVLEHLPHPEETLHGLLELLKPGGILFVEGPVEKNASPVYFAATLFGAIKRQFKPTIGTTPPTHLFRVDSKVQREFLERIAPSAELVSWSVYETGWPYAEGGGTKRAIAAVAVALGGRRLFGATFGNRFCGLFRMSAGSFHV